MKKLLKLLTLLTISSNFAMAASDANAAKTVGLKCEIFYNRVAQSNLPYKTVIDIPIVKNSASKLGLLYNFDRVQTLEQLGRPDLFIWTKADYFHNNEQSINSYVRFNTSLCKKAADEAKAKCVSSDYSGDVFAELVQQNTSFRGKKVQMKGAYLLEKESEAIDTMTNYRIEHGHDISDDIDMSTPEGNLKYLQILGPQINVTCSIRDDAFGVTSAY